MRTKIVLSIIFIFYTVLVYRAYDLSIKSNEKYTQLSLQNREKKISIAPVRGVIYDRKGSPVAYNELRLI